MNAVVEVTERIDKDVAPEAGDKVFLTFDQRRKYRLKTVSEQGNEVRIFLQRDKPMQIGDVLRSETGQVFLVQPVNEPVVIARTEDWQSISKICYHLGNRHLSLQVGEREIRFKPDHVIEELVASFGLEVNVTEGLFEPESGAYSKGHHAAGGDHSHSTHHTHADGRSHSHAH